MTAPDEGWYPDPDQPGEARYWDGSTWTGARRALDTPPATTDPVDTGGSPRARRKILLVIAGLALVALVGGFVIGSFVLDDGDDSEPVVAKRRTSTTSTSTTTRPAPTTTTTAAFVPPPPQPEPATPGGDLGIPGRPMSVPACTGSYIVHLAAATTPGGYQSAISRLLTQHPGSSYLRTDQTCSSLRPADNGNPIYSVFYGPYRTLPDACTALSRSPGAYIRILDNVTAPRTNQPC